MFSFIDYLTTLGRSEPVQHAPIATNPRNSIRNNQGNSIEIFVPISVYWAKVCLLMMVEVGIFPSVCGWWIDICSLVS